MNPVRVPAVILVLRRKGLEVKKHGTNCTISDGETVKGMPDGAIQIVSEHLLRRMPGWFPDQLGDDVDAFLAELQEQQLELLSNPLTRAFPQTPGIFGPTDLDD